MLKRHRSQWGHNNSVTTDPTKMVHLSKFEFYHGISQNILVTIYLDNNYKKCKKKNIYRKERLKVFRTSNFFQHFPPLKSVRLFGFLFRISSGESTDLKEITNIPPSYYNLLAVFLVESQAANPTGSSLVALTQLLFKNRDFQR